MLENLINRSRKDYEYFTKFTKLSDNFNQLWRLKSITRDNLRDWLMNNNVDPVLSENVTNACSELIENSIKFSKENEEIFVLVNISGRKIIVETFNMTGKAQKTKMLSYIEKLNKDTTDISELYVKSIQESVRRGVSRLGILKILLETGGKLELLDKDKPGFIHIKLTINEKEMQMYRTMSGHLDMAFDQMKFFEQSQTDLKESLKNVIGSSPIILFAFGLNGILTLAEGRRLDFFTNDINKIIGSSVFDFFNKLNIPEKDIQRSLNGEEFVSIIEIEDSVFEAHWTNLHKANGEFSGVTVIATDITDRVIAEEQYRHIFENSLEGIFQTTPAGGFVSINPAMARILGYNSTEELKEKISNITQQLYVDPNKRDELFSILIKQGYIHNFECRLYRRDRSIIWASLHVTAVKNENNEITLIEGLLQDISERKNAEEWLKQAHNELEYRVKDRTEELAAAKKAAETANNTKSEFLANMSHELRTPLNSILGYAQILKQKSNLNKFQVDSMNIIQRAGEHLLTLINDVLDLSKIEAGKLELYPSEFSLAVFLENIVEMIRMRVDQKFLDFEFQYLSPLPSCVKADEKRIRQVLINLLSNAVKFTDQGKISFQVRVIDENELSISPPKPATVKIRFQVTDTGVGMSKQETEKIFSPFVQVGNLSKRSKGIGLGLSISQKLLQQMDSFLQVESEVGKGSIFRFDLDLPVTTLEVKHRIDKQRDIVGYHGPAKKILIVDDDENNRAVLTGLLKYLKFTVEEVDDGEKAVNMAQEMLPDLIFMDLVMPVMNGFEATKTLRNNPKLKDVVIIAVSASVYEKHKKQGLLSGCNDFLGKPIMINDIIETLTKHLNLEWIFEEIDEQHDRDKELNSKKTIIPPEKKIMQELLKLARVGDILSILNLAESMENMDEKFLPFAQQLKQLASGFQIEKTLKFVEKYAQNQNDSSPD